LPALKGFLSNKDAYDFLDLITISKQSCKLTVIVSEMLIEILLGRILFLREKPENVQKIT
jgi:hypothetical protein